ncbi:hypothetical protein T265_03857 [Opisthorchis viverrini]|uniref:Uncharacterized protein n=1 Tax=Opisthorchis viverrini TaxID=6198 RepID=A0A075A1Z2_OPIVI|nr:hypothetical protein T265_03857 [Opisthorchis viverrini]KER29560.1 hypothetical protein T265_03857 [Opisthorchis viverrini]
MAPTELRIHDRTSMHPVAIFPRFLIPIGSERAQWLDRKFTDRKVRGSNPACASRLPMSRRGQPGSIPVLRIRNI